MSRPNFSIVLICRNEEKTIPRMFASLSEYVKKGGDVNIVDTGSTDNSVAVARALGIRVKEVGTKFLHTIDDKLAKQINQRFIVQNEMPIVKAGETYFDFSSARNEATWMGDCDWCCTMDCDEVMTSFNVDKIDEIIASDPEIAHFEYNFVFSHLENGDPFIQFIQSKFYNRTRMQWEGIIHELVTPTIGGKRYMLGPEVFQLEHFQNVETNRTGYLRGLAVDCFNHQEKDRNSHYFAREMWWNGRPYSAAKEFKRHIEMNKWPAERAESMLFLADIYGAMEKPEDQLYWAHRALDTEPNRREPLIKLAQIHMRKKQWTPANFYATAALELPWYPFYGANKSFYTNEPHEILFNAKGWLGDIKGAQEHLLKCLEYQPHNQHYLYCTKFYWTYGDNGIAGWMEFPALNFLYEISTHMESVCEVGSFKGKSTHAIASGLAASGLNSGKVTAVDHWQGSADPKDLTNQISKQEDVFAVFQENMKGFSNLKINRKPSLEAVNDYSDGAFDMIFIDAGHTYEECRADIRAWKPKAKILLCGHDYWPEVWPGVVRAVDEELGGPDFVHGTLWGKWLNTPLVSICVPTLGRPEKLHRLLEAIKANADYDNYEIIVKADEMPPNNVGAPKMLDYCVSEAKGNLIMFLGNDCVPEKGFLREAVWAMIRNFPEMDGLIALNDGYWKPDQGHVATHWLGSRKLLDILPGGNFFFTGYNHTGPDNELTALTQMAGKFAFAEKAKIFHDHPINSGFAWSDPLYEQAYAGPRHEADDKLYAERAKKYGFADRKWS